MRFVLMVNKQGQTRLAQYYEFNQMEERCALEAEVIRKCLARTETQVIACRHAHARARPANGCKHSVLCAPAPPPAPPTPPTTPARSAPSSSTAGTRWSTDDTPRSSSSSASRGRCAPSPAPPPFSSPPPSPSPPPLAPPPPSPPAPQDENELAILEFIHALVETLDRYFENVCELDIMFNLEKARPRRLTTDLPNHFFIMLELERALHHRRHRTIRPCAPALLPLFRICDS